MRTEHCGIPLHGGNVAIPENKKSLIFVIFRGCSKNYEINPEVSGWFFGIILFFFPSGVS